MSVKQPTLPFNKANFYVLAQEREMLKITLDFLSSESLRLKTQLEDMRITVKHNKEQLEEYVTKITNKDKIFEKMKSQIDQLTSRLKVLDKKNRKKCTQTPSPQVNDVIDNKINVINQTSTSATTTLVNSSSLPNKDDKILINNKKMDDKFKEFFCRQSEIIEEMNIMKDDVQFLLEYKSKTKLKEHLDQSMSSNRSSNSNISYVSNKNPLNDSMSNVNSSIISNHTTNTMRKKINLKERFQFTDNLGDFLLGVNIKKNILLMVDTKGEIWELIKRKDLTICSVKSHPEYIKSIIPNDIDKSIANSSILDSREYDNRSLKQSELDLSKSDFNLSRMIKESDLV